MKISEIKYDESFNWRGPIEVDDDLLNLAESIKKEGLLQPVIIDQNNFLLAGYRRRRAALLAEMDELATYTVECQNDEQRHRINLLENTLRKGLPRHKEVEAIKPYTDLGTSAIMRTVSRSAEWVKCRVSLSVLPEDLLVKSESLSKRDVLHIEKMTRGQPDEIVIAAYKSAMEGKNKGKRVQSKKPSVREIKAMRDEVREMMGSDTPINMGLGWVLGDVDEEDFIKSIQSWKLRG